MQRLGSKEWEPKEIDSIQDTADSQGSFKSPTVEEMKCPSRSITMEVEINQKGNMLNSKDSEGKELNWPPSRINHWKQL